MPWVSIAIVLLVIVVVSIITAMKKASPSSGQTFPYVKKDTLLTPAERSFLGVLEQAVGEQYRIYAQVRLADLMAVKHGGGKSARASAQNRINCKHADFVLCNKETLEIVCAAELDDASHQRAQRKDRDDFVQKACRAAGLPLARFAVKESYTIPEVMASIQQVVGAQQQPFATTTQALPLNGLVALSDEASNGNAGLPQVW